VVYRELLARVEPDRELFLALNDEIFVNLFVEPIGRLLLDNHRVRPVVFDRRTEVIEQWIP
jgi:hypothetical protein